MKLVIVLIDVRYSHYCRFSLFWDITFNQVICHFSVPLSIVTDHGSHFQNHMMMELTSMLGFRQDQSSSYYPQVNGQVEAINGVLKTMIRRLVDNHKKTSHRKLYSTLWVLRLQQDDELSGKESPSLSGPAGYFWHKVYF